MKAIKQVFGALCLASWGTAVVAETTTPVVTLVNVQATDTSAYTNYLAENPGIFKALGAQAGGTCVTVSGHRYPGQAFAWSIYPDAAAAFKSAQMYSRMPRNADLDAISSVVSAEFFAILKPFSLPSGFERRYQIVVNDPAAYIAAATKLEKTMQANGHKVEVGIFQPMGNGHQKANLLDVRIFAVEPEVAGMMVNDFLQRKSWALEPYAEMLATVESLELDTFEDCKQLYTAQ